MRLHSNVTGINPRNCQHFLRRQFTQRIRCERTVAVRTLRSLCTRPVMSSLIMFCPFSSALRRSTRWDDPAYSLLWRLFVCGVWECANGITIQWLSPWRSARKAAGPWQREITNGHFWLPTVKRQLRPGFQVNNKCAMTTRNKDCCIFAVSVGLATTSASFFGLRNNDLCCSRMALLFHLCAA